jgi:hypothetical protein
MAIATRSEPPCRAIPLLSLLLLALTLFTACGSSPPTHWTLNSAGIRESYAALHVQYDCSFSTAGREVRMVWTVDGVDAEERFFKGDGRVWSGFDIPGSYFPFENRAKRTELQSRITVPNTWSVSPLVPGARHVLIEYDDLDGRKVRLELRT